MGDMYPCCYHDHVAEAIEAEQNSTNTEIEVLKTEIERNRHVLKSIANLIEESI